MCSRWVQLQVSIMLSSKCLVSKVQSFPWALGGLRTIHVTAPTFAEPLRKKKVVNPLITKKQYERKVRRLEREINRLEAVPPKLKPILELQLPPQVAKELNERQRTTSDDDYHQLLKFYYKAWSIFKSLESQQEINYIKTVARAQEKALNLLKKDYPDLYSAAIQIDPKLIPFRVDYPKKDTPPNEDYTCPDGKEQDITKEWRL